MTARYYKIQLAKGTPYSALKVWFGPPTDPLTDMPMYDRSSIWRALLNGEHTPIEMVMIEIDGNSDRPVIKGDECTEIEYLRVLKTYLWAKEHAPNDPVARPREAIDLNRMPTLF